MVLGRLSGFLILWLIVVASNFSITQGSLLFSFFLVEKNGIGAPESGPDPDKSVVVGITIGMISCESDISVSGIRKVSDLGLMMLE